MNTDNEAQGQSAKLVDVNGVILCLNLDERLRDFHYLPKDEKTLVMAPDLKPYERSFQRTKGSLV